MPEPAVRGLLDELQRADVVVSLDPDGDHWDAKRPDLVAAAALRQHQARGVQIHQAEDRLMEVFRFARLQSEGAADVELVRGREETFRRFREMQEKAATQVRAIDRPPYYWDDTEIVRQEKLQCAQMADGIVYRTIYQESENDSPVRSAGMARTIACGEQVRVLARPPIKATFIDDEIAIIALDPPDGADDTLVAQIVYRSGLLDALLSIFETLWQLAVPVNHAGPGTPQERGGPEREILTLMASGATDDAIARRLGLSRRTVVRRVGLLLEQLGATTRFQAGAQAARRGWL